jgi:hypothetical protein
LNIFLRNLNRILKENKRRIRVLGLGIAQCIMAFRVPLKSRDTILFSAKKNAICQKI